MHTDCAVSAAHPSAARAVLAAVLFLGEQFSEVNAVGLCVLILGVVLFNVTKYRKMKRPTLERTSAKSPSHTLSLGEMKRSASTLGGSPLDGQTPVTPRRYSSQVLAELQGPCASPPSWSL